MSAAPMPITVEDALREDVTIAHDYNPPTTPERWRWLATEEPYHALFGYGEPCRGYEEVSALLKRCGFVRKDSATREAWNDGKAGDSFWPQHTHSLLRAAAWKMADRGDGVLVVSAKAENRFYAELAGKRWAELVDATQRDHDDFFLFAGNAWPFSDADALDMSAVDVDNSLTDA